MKLAERVADHLGLLVDLLGHEVAEVALVDQQRARHRLDGRPLDLAAVEGEDLGLLPGQHRAVAILQIGDGVGEGGERDGVGAQIHLALAVADGERRSLPGPDHQVVLAGEDDGERKRPLQPLQGGLGRLGGREALIQIVA